MCLFTRLPYNSVSCNWHVFKKNQVIVVFVWFPFSWMKISYIFKKGCVMVYGSGGCEVICMSPSNENVYCPNVTFFLNVKTSSSISTSSCPAILRNSSPALLLNSSHTSLALKWRHCSFFFYSPLHRHSGATCRSTLELLHMRTLFQNSAGKSPA